MKIHAIQTGEVQIKTRHAKSRFGPRPLRILDVLSDRNWSERLPITCWAIEHPDGVIVVDTGESSHINDPGYAPSWHLFAQKSNNFWVEPEEEEVGPQLHELGLHPSSVRTVVMTHMHGDHIGGIGHFPNSEIVISEREAKAAFARSGPINGYFNKHYPDWLSPRTIRFDGEPWESFNSSVLLTGDGAIRLIPTPGHTLGHLSVVVDQGEWLTVIAGDAAYSERALLDSVVDGVAESATAHRDSSERLLELCRRRPVVFLPTHDPQSARRLADRAVTTPV